MNRFGDDRKKTVGRNVLICMADVHALIAAYGGSVLAESMIRDTHRL